MAVKRKTKEQDPAEIDPLFVLVVKAFARARSVSRESRKGFGSGALKVNGKIFAMMSSKGKFVVKLPKNRVDELVSGSKGERFDPGHGRIMKEWFVAGAGKANWVELAEEAFLYVKQAKP
jgi:hypothetical protein